MDEYDYIPPDTAPPQPARPRPVVTFALIGLNILAFLIMTIMGGSDKIDVLVRMGAKDSALIWQGQYWRLLTSAFLHAGLLHIGFNLYALYQLGQIGELIYGPRRMLGVYMLSGLMASVASLIGSPSLSVGASGAIFGLFGALLYFGWRLPRVFKQVFGYQIFVVLAINLFIGFSMPNIDNFAHLGGLVSGFLAALAIGLPGERKQPLKTAAVLTLFAAVTAYGIFPAPTSWHYHYYSGKALLHRGEAGPASVELESAYRIHPQSRDIRSDLQAAHFNLGVDAYKQGDFRQAAVHFERAAAVYPLAANNYNAAVANYRLGDRKRAADYARRALENDPQFGQARDLLRELGP